MGNPTQLFAVYGKKRVPVASVEDAANRWNDFRDRSGGGASEIGNGVVVVDARGVAVAEISYNGRIWKPGGKELLVADDHPAQPGKPFRVEDTWRPQVKAKSATCPKCGKTGSAAKLKKHVATCRDSDRTILGDLLTVPRDGFRVFARRKSKSEPGENYLTARSFKTRQDAEAAAAKLGNEWSVRSWGRLFYAVKPEFAGGCSRKNCDLPAGHPGNHATDYAARSKASGTQLTLETRSIEHQRHDALSEFRKGGPNADAAYEEFLELGGNPDPEVRRTGGFNPSEDRAARVAARVAGTTEKWTPEPGPNGGMWAHTAGEYVLAVWPSNNPSDRAAGFWWWAVSRHGHPVADGRKVGMEAAMLRAEEYVRLTTAEPEKPAVCGAKLHNERDARRYNWTQTCVLPSGHPGAHQPGQLTAAQFEHARHTAMTYADGVFEIRDAGPLSRFRKTGHWRVPGTNPPIVMAMTGDADGSYTVVGLDGKKYFGSSKEDAVDFALRGQKMEKPK